MEDGACKAKVRRGIILLGAPGSGKGTLARRLAQHYKVPHISSGDLFRVVAQRDDETGRQLRNVLSEGRYGADDVARKLVFERLAEADCGEGYVLDGFPRTLEQCLAMEAHNADEGGKSVLVQIEVPDEEIIGRLKHRRSCPQCGSIYNLRFDPPAVSGQCDNEACQGVALVIREDDKEETIRERFRVFHERTAPVIARCEEQGVLNVVKAAGMTPDDVFVKVEEILRTKRVEEV